MTVEHRELTDNIINFLVKHPTKKDRDVFLKANEDLLKDLPLSFLVEIQGEMGNE